MGMADRLLANYHTTNTQRKTQLGVHEDHFRKLASMLLSFGFRVMCYTDRIIISKSRLVAPVIRFYF